MAAVGVGVGLVGGALLPLLVGALTRAALPVPVEAGICISARWRWPPPSAC